jgi:hypothetical protein
MCLAFREILGFERHRQAAVGGRIGLLSRSHASFSAGRTELLLPATRVAEARAMLSLDGSTGDRLV